MYHPVLMQLKKTAIPRSFPLLLSLCVCLILLATAAQAATAYLTPQINYRPTWGQDSVDVEFSIDVGLCREAYGKNWANKCDAWLGEVGSEPMGIVAKNWPKGRWAWAHNNRLRFYPSGYWKSDTDYTVDLTNLELPPRVKLGEKQVSFHSIPRCASIDKGHLWVDPSAKAEHAISFSMNFTESLSEDTRRMLENQATPIAEKNSGLTLAKGQWVWLEDNSRAVVNARVLTLPKQKSTVSLTLPNVRPIWKEENTWHFPKRDAKQEMVVLGSNATFRLENVHLETVPNKNLAVEYHVIFNFSQRVKAEDFLKATTFLELPLKRSEENLIPTNWTEGGVSPEIQKQARKLQPQIVRVPDENEDYLRFRLNATPGSYIFWNIAAGFGPTSNKGVHSPLERRLEGVEYVPTNSPRLELLQAGNVLMQDSNIALMSEHVDSIRWSAHRFEDNTWALPALFELNNTLSERLLDANTTVQRGELTLNVTEASKESYASKPNFTTLSAKDVFSTANKDITPGLVYLHLEGIKDGKVVVDNGRILMFSNMGLIHKEQADGSSHVYTCSLEDASALNDVLIQVLGRNGLPIAEVRTQKDGSAVLPKLDHFTREKAPTALVARKKSGSNEDILLLSLTKRDRQVNLSRFADQQGRQSSTNTLNAFVFSERGLFRPGETMNFGVLLRANDWKMLPKNMPLKATLLNPTSHAVWKKSFVAGESIHSFTWDVPQNALTGKYHLYISTPTETQNADDMGLILGSTEVKVADFMPDTLRLSTSLVDTAKTKQNVSTKGWVITSEKAGTLALNIHLRTLFGQAAAQRRVRANMYLEAPQLRFQGYEDYIFQDTNPFFAQSDDPIERTLQQSTTDAKGEALLPLDFSQWRFGTMLCTINTEGFESNGGRAVYQTESFLLSPLPFMLGFKAGLGADNRSFILKGSKAQLAFQAVDAQLQPTSPGKLVFSIARRNTVTSLVTNSQGLYSFETTPVDTQISQAEQSIPSDGKLQWDIPTTDVGEYLLTVKTSESSHASLSAGTVLARVSFSIVGNDDLRPALLQAHKRPEAKLHIKTDKSEYNGGDTAKLMVTAPYEGVALISLERDSVAAHKWVKLPVGNSLQELAIPQDFTGRGYIQVLMGRSPDSENIFLQPQSVTMTPINVNVSQREVAITITAPEKTLPGKPLQWHIKNTNGKATKALLYAVDEGILQISKYKTPNPLYYLLLDRALEVSTSQLFDRIMVKDGQIMKHLSAFGGDGGDDDLFAGLLGTFQNPFKRKIEPPVVWWSGVVDIPAEGLTVDVPVPSYYNGSVRLMAVLQNEDAVGSAEERVIVQGEQVLSPQLPLAVALGDSFEAGLGITNTTDKAVTLTLALSLDAKSEAKDITLSDLPTSVSLKPKEEAFVPFKVRVGQQPGDATLTFDVQTDAGNSFTRTTSMSVRPAILPKAQQQSFMVSQATSLHNAANLLPYGAQTSLTLSPTPLPLLRSSLNYLKNYPFDCVEQLISKAFPLAVLANSSLAPLLEQAKVLPSSKEREKAFTETREALAAAFNASYESGIGLWTTSYSPDIFVSAYAADYLLAMQEAKLPVPQDLMMRILYTLDEQINSKPGNLKELRDTAYATWVLARAGYVVSKPLELCEAFIEESGYTESDIFNSFMAGAYAALYMQPEAQKHLDKVKGTAPQQWTHSSDMLDSLAQYGLHTQVLAKHFPKELLEAIPFMQSIFLEGLNKPHATLGAAMSAVALIDILQATPVIAMRIAQGQHVGLTCAGYHSDMKPATDPAVQLFSGLTVLDAPGCARFDVTVPKDSQYFAEIQNYGYNRFLPTEPVAQKARVEKTLTLSDGSAFTGEVVQGDVVQVKITLTPTQEREANIAVVDLLPGGFELVMDHEDDLLSHHDAIVNKREDRVISFMVLNHDTVTLIYHIRATNTGTYTLPPTHAEGLYDASIYSTTAKGEISVVAP